MMENECMNQWKNIIEAEETIITDSQILNILMNAEACLRTQSTCGDKVKFFYRGESKDYGKTSLTPSVFRDCNEKEEYYDAITHFPQEFSGLSSLSKLAKMQHYTYPTRLLDLTTNPLVALWFACSDYSRYTPKNRTDEDGYFFIIAVHEKGILSCDSDRALLLASLAKLDDEVEKPALSKLLTNIMEKMSVGFCVNNELINELRALPELGLEIKIFDKYIGEIIRERPAFTNYNTQISDLFSTFIVQSKIENERQRKQEGVFAIFGLSSPLFNNNIKYKIKRFRIPKTSKKQIIVELDKLGINEATLFGDMESRANYNRFMKNEGKIV